MKQYFIWQISKTRVTPDELRNRFFDIGAEMAKELLNRDAYVRVSEIFAERFSDAFTVGNLFPEGQIVWTHNMHSVSVGDLIEDGETGEIRVVMPIGFESLGIPPAFA